MRIRSGFLVFSQDRFSMASLNEKGCEWCEGGEEQNTIICFRILYTKHIESLKINSKLK